MTTIELVKEVQRNLLSKLDNQQLAVVGEALQRVMEGRSIIEENPMARHDDDMDYVELFIAAKRIEGCSERTLTYYERTIRAMLDCVKKGPSRIMTDDLRKYLTGYQETRNCNRVTIDNVRRILSSFFAWLEDEDYIIKSPVRRIHKVRTGIAVKDTYSDEMLELMRDTCLNPRDLAVIDLLASTGMRIGELVNLRREDLDFEERECLVLGKGNKERIVYFDARTKIHLSNYLSSRNDRCPYLFVSLNAPHERMTISGLETMLRKLGDRLGIAKVYPHKFRRTLATVAIDKGMPIEQVQCLLGHKKIDTTLRYAMVRQQNVKQAHRKYIG